MKPPRSISFAVALVLSASLFGTRSDAGAIKLATLVPDGSPWHEILEEMGHAWSKGTAQRVTLRVYPGGVAGDDPDMVRKMRIGQLQAASLTVAGLIEIEPSFNIMAIPLLFESQDEYIFVRDAMTRTLTAKLEAKGFVLLHWGHGGWVHFFSKDPARTVDDLRKTKIFTWAGDENMVQGYRANGFNPVSLAATDILTGLQTGMINALPATPLAALSLQWFRLTPYMLRTPIAPLIGATVITKKSWDALSAADQAILREAARAAEKRLDDEIPRKDLASIDEMKLRGLTVIEIESSAVEAQWQAVGASFAERMSSVVPREIYDEALAHRARFREKQAAATAR